MALDRLFGRKSSVDVVDASVVTQVDMPAASEPPVAESSIIVATATDTGCIRELNEDAVQVVRDNNESSSHGLLAVVCDGMGGHAAGEVASRIAIDTIAREWRATSDPAVSLRQAVLAANRAILAVSATNRGYAGMGTTVIAVIIREGMAWCAHVGDSRCYLLRDNQLFLMTEDHSAVMELVKRGHITADAARAHPDKNVISRALGARRDVDVTVWPRPFRVRSGDHFLLCSDGLYDVVSDERMREILSSYEPDEACEQLIANARANGAPDNVTVAILAAPSVKSQNEVQREVGITRAVGMPVVSSAPAAEDVA